MYLLKGMMTKYLHQNIDSSKETKTIKYSGINRIARVIIDQEVWRGSRSRVMIDQRQVINYKSLKANSLIIFKVGVVNKIICYNSIFYPLFLIFLKNKSQKLAKNNKKKKKYIYIYIYIILMYLHCFWHFQHLFKKNKNSKIYFQHV